MNELLWGNVGPELHRHQKGEASSGLASNTYLDPTPTMCLFVMAVSHTIVKKSHWKLTAAEKTNFSELTAQEKKVLRKFGFR